MTANSNALKRIPNIFASIEKIQPQKAYKVRCLTRRVEIATKPPPNAKLAVLILINDVVNLTNKCVREMFSM